MEQFWFKMVESGIKTIDDVPEKYKSKVLILLSKKENNNDNSEN